MRRKKLAWITKQELKEVNSDPDNLQNAFSPPLSARSRVQVSPEKESNTARQ
jgi:hypothetical protein